MNSSLKRGSKVPRQCYVEEQAKPRDSFMVEAYKILKSLMKSMRRLIIHLGTDDDHSCQASSIQAIQSLLTETLSAMTTEGDLQSLIQVSTLKDQ